MKVAAAYIRVSTDDQLEFSPDSQLEKIRLYAERNQMVVPNEFVFLDEGISGRNTKKRTAFNVMIGLAKSKPKPFDAILVWKFSRFARNREDSVVYKSILRKELNIDVISISEDIGDDKMAVLIEAMIEAMDEYYSINLAEEVKRGMTEKAKRGGVLSIPGFGYKIENGEYVIVPDEAEIIRKVFHDYANGKGYLAIAKSLNAMGIKSHRGNSIENRTVEYWLNNPLYIGKTRWNPEGKLSRNYNAETVIIRDGTHTPIIDTEIWDKVHCRMKWQKEKFRRYYNADRNKLSHWLTGIVRCEKCGAVLSYQGGFFGCSNRCRGTCEGVGYIKADKLENIVLEILSHMDIQNVEPRYVKPAYMPLADEVDDNIIVFTQMKKYECRLERAKIAYMEGIDTLSEYKEAKRYIEQEMLKLKEIQKSFNEKKETKISHVNISDLRRMNDILRDSNISNIDKNRMIRAVFKEITKGGNAGKTLKCIFWY